ncbi:MAG TPA: cupin domain-containing protein [Candidatus Saccharimonadales bacterium]|nr:cupin domain-containing protein [Candidatus Saccharimonadales bacterium]
MIFNTTHKPEIEELINAWQQYIATMGDWQKVVEGVTPKQTYCGPVYEPASPLNRPNESFATADMRGIKVAEPHYHSGGETETYFVISGSGLTVVGGEELEVKAGDVIVTPPGTAHFTLPKENLVLIVINTPPFNPDNNIHVDATKPEVKYDHEQFERLVAK